MVLTGFRVQRDNGERVIAHADVNDAPVASGGTRVLVHTGGAGRTSQVVWKSLRVNAD